MRVLQILGNVENYHASLSLNIQTQILTSSTKTIKNPPEKGVRCLHSCLFVLHKQNREINLIALQKQTPIESKKKHTHKHSYVPTHKTNPVFIESIE